MGEIGTKLFQLFTTYYNGTATADERDELFYIIQSATNDPELTALIHQAWEALEVKDPLFDRAKSNDMLNNILQAAKEDEAKNIQLRTPKSSWIKLGMAAAIAFCLGTGAYIYHNQKERISAPKTIAKAHVVHDALPGSNKAILTLANGKTIVLDSAQNGLLAKEGNTKIKKTKNGQLVYQAGQTGAAQQAALNTVTTPRGGEYQLVLQDGSKVWLNSASSISFPAVFTGKTREVSITGEAYFEIAKNPAKPFRVKALNSVVEVLGTHFNMMAYNDEAEMKTTLLEGSVKIVSGTATGMLKPGQQAVISKSGSLKVVDDVDVDDETAWKNGIFQFRDAGIETIMRQAARWYDVDISYAGIVPKREFNGRISRNVKASELLSMLSYSGVNFKIEDKHIIVLQ